MGTEDFWSDDAAALQQREAERVTGLRRPPTSDTRISSTGVADLRMPAASVVIPPELVGSHAIASADYRAMPRGTRINVCVHCQRPVSPLAVLCPECGMATRSASQPIHWPAIIVSGMIAAIAWFLIDYMLN